MNKIYFKTSASTPTHLHHNQCRHRLYWLSVHTVFLINKFWSIEYIQWRKSFFFFLLSYSTEGFLFFRANFQVLGAIQVRFPSRVFKLDSISRAKLRETKYFSSYPLKLVFSWFKKVGRLIFPYSPTVGYSGPDGPDDIEAVIISFDFYRPKKKNSITSIDAVFRRVCIFILRRFNFFVHIFNKF